MHTPAICSQHSGFNERIKAVEKDSDEQGKEIKRVDLRLTALENRLIGAVLAATTVITLVGEVIRHVSQRIGR
jgi:hypothetical protein